MHLCKNRENLLHPEYLKRFLEKSMYYSHLIFEGPGSSKTQWKPHPLGVGEINHFCCLDVDIVGREKL